MATKPKPKRGNVLKRKLGPLPVWAWALALAATFYLWRRHKASSSAGAADVNPNSAIYGYSPPTGTAPVPAAGSSTGSDPNTDLLNALLGQNQNAYQALIAALQTSGAGYGGTFGGGGGDASAPSVNFGPLDQTQQAAPSSPSAPPPASSAAPTSPGPVVGHAGGSPVYAVPSGQQPAAAPTLVVTDPGANPADVAAFGTAAKAKVAF